MTAWIKAHPYATGGIVLFVGVLFLLLRGKGGSSAASSSTSALGAAEQIAQIQAAAGAQSAQVNAQVSAAQISANAQTQAQNDALAAQEFSVLGDVSKTALSYKATLAGYDAQTAQTKATLDAQTKAAGLQAGIYHDLITTAAEETASNNALQASALASKYTAVGKAIDLTKQGGRGNIGANELALILGQGDISSFNNANASTSIASSISTASIIKSISGIASSALGGLFG